MDIPMINLGNRIRRGEGSAIRRRGAAVLLAAMLLLAVLAAACGVSDAPEQRDSSDRSSGREPTQDVERESTRDSESSNTRASGEATTDAEIGGAGMSGTPSTGPARESTREAKAPDSVSGSLVRSTSEPLRETRPPSHQSTAGVAPPRPAPPAPPCRSADMNLPHPAQTSVDTDREALIVLLEAADHRQNFNTSEFSEKLFSDWPDNLTDIVTDDSGRAARLKLQSNGEPPAEVGYLTALTDLSIVNSSGDIPPEFCNLVNLTSLGLQGYGLTSEQPSGKIPAELGNLVNLKFLMLDRSHLSGEIPPELGNLANLTHLSLDNNQLSGEIPVELGNLASLSFLSLDSKQLRWEILLELNNLKRLHLNLGGAEIPPELFSLSNVEWLAISGASGEIPPELGKLVNLKSLSFYNSQLSGCIPGSLEGRSISITPRDLQFC